MTAPERIWVTERPSMTRMGVCHVYALTGSEEYIRADLVADQISAAVQAEREACAVEVVEFGALEHGSLPAAPWIEKSSASHQVAAAIRARGDKC